MAPEIVRRQPYDLSIDIYSFGILLWQMCTLKVPFEEYCDIKSFNHDIAYHHKRPLFNKKDKKLIPLQLLDLIMSSWSGNVYERPTISLVTLILKEVIESLHSENGTNVVDITNRLDDKYYRRRSSTG